MWMPTELQKLAMAVLARSQHTKRDTTWDSRQTVAGQVSHSAKVAGTAKLETNQGDDPSVPLSHALGNGTLGQSANSGTLLGTVVGQQYRGAFSTLIAQCPDHVDRDRWQQAIADATTFISEWGARAEALGWTSADLFGLHTPPEKPAPSYRRLSRYDQTGLIWLLRGRSVIALTSTEAVILCHSGATLKFCRAPKPPWRRPSTPSRRSAGRRQRRSSPWRREVTQARENGNDKSVFTLLTIAPRAGKI
jgi:hypothetical protein